LILLLCFACAAAGTALVDWALESGWFKQPYTQVRGSPPRLMLGKLPEGTAAPDFTLPSLQDGREVRLSSFRGDRPVVLVFGSCSCDLFHNEIEDLERLYKAYKQHAAFVFVYIEEAAHFIPGLEFLVEDLPTSPCKRRQLLRKAVALVKLTIPTVLDREDNRVEKAYRAFPLRLVVVGKDGRIARDLGNGVVRPWDLDKLETWLKAHT
jgi:thyroxine 5-deiodinase